ncbi:MAG: M20/M25/M40 family metallo-hydrolase [Bacteroidia bacterium]|nr:M20/M25/M40 family metallo-hydrolase [Bacteroidia bacterium]MBT8275371.1 M20/M25/M40 family metallo-hydrolase [Bacteroidia bacterium]NNF31963.1 M20/M25/M40 family metallo-hydrolase [Flavobacteriaceae bacterium]NNK54335.1 M20/M25/M40 family metallo-hydrolase [Flavobacteriaceae bacterium]NNM09711.1 M20/M25/M40 family metallo-hydrolase [Flavobacteriaceae bacterium]
MKHLLIITLSLLTISCNSAQTASQQTIMTRVDYANTITAEELKTHLYTFASDNMEGRMTGTDGQKLAAEYLRNFYMDNGISSPIEENNYYQPIPASYLGRRITTDSENIVAFIKGSEKPDEVIVLSAHYDHVGKREDGTIYNGADDDGSGTVAMLEIAEAFQQAVNDGNGPKRSLLFLHVTGEEIGLYGSKYYTENPLFPLENTVCNLNTDMIGRIDPDKEGEPDYVYLIGSDRLSQELHDVSEAVNSQYVNLELDYKFNAENDPNRFYYRSDHYNFAKNNIPVIFYFNGVHEDYHQPTDTPDKIEYDLMTKRTQLIFQTAWEIANREGRIRADKS